MAQSTVDLCNKALQRVGAASIMSLTDNSREARACAKAYDICRRDELRKHVWNFAISRAALAADTASPPFDKAYRYALPADCLRVLLPGGMPVDWILEGRSILSSSAGPLNLRYVADVTDCTMFDACFYTTLAISVATDICEPLTQSNSKRQQLDAEYKDAISAARRVDAFETLPAEAVLDAWWLARY
jgi:hypothetical protein